jgi:hypothetical protein
VPGRSPLQEVACGFWIRARWPTGARTSRHRKPEHIRRHRHIVQWWVGRLCRTRRTQFTSTGTPASDVNAPCVDTRWAGRDYCRCFTSLGPPRRLAAHSSSVLEQDPVPAPFPQGMAGRSLEACVSWSTRTARLADGLTTTSNDLRAALVKAPMALLRRRRKAAPDVTP